MHPDKLSLRLQQFEENNRCLTPNERKKFEDASAEHFKTLQDAFELLSDASKKRWYDQGCDKEQCEERSKSYGGFSGFGGGFRGF